MSPSYLVDIFLSSEKTEVGVLARMSNFRKIGVACDHAGKDLKLMVTEYLKISHLTFVDFGVGEDNTKSVDYPDFAEILSSAILKGQIDAAIAICGTGIGMSIAANKFPTIRAACAWDDYSANMSRSHNDANILCLGSRTLNYHRAIDIVKIWLNTPFAGDRHELRLDKIRTIEKKNFKPI